MDLPISSERLAPAVTGAKPTPIIPRMPLTAPNEPVVIRVIANGYDYIVLLGFKNILQLTCPSVTTFYVFYFVT